MTDGVLVSRSREPVAVNRDFKGPAGSDKGQSVRKRNTKVLIPGVLIRGFL